MIKFAVFYRGRDTALGRIKLYKHTDEKYLNGDSENFVPYEK